MIRSIVLFFCLLLNASAFSQEQLAPPSVYDEVVLELNNGEKWLVNENMLKPLQKSFELIENAGTLKKGSQHRLFRKLWKLSDKIADVCYLEGEGHHVFHAWFMPYINLLEALRDELFVEDANNILEDLRHSVEIYHTYFE